MHIHLKGSAYWCTNESLSPHLKSPVFFVRGAETDLDLFCRITFYRHTQP